MTLGICLACSLRFAFLTALSARDPSRDRIGPSGLHQRARWILSPFWLTNDLAQAGHLWGRLSATISSSCVSVTRSYLRTGMDLVFFSEMLRVALFVYHINYSNIEHFYTRWTMPQWSKSTCHKNLPIIIDRLCKGQVLLSIKLTYTLRPNYCHVQVNFAPALGNDCQADIAVKLPMLIDLLKLIRRKIVVPRPLTQCLKKRRSRVNLLRNSGIFNF